MVGKCKRKACPYGCCDPDFAGSGRKNKRLNKKRVKQKEKRWWRKQATEDLT